MAKKQIIPITDLENLIDWYYELTIIKGYSESEALNYMSYRAPMINLNQMAKKLQLNPKLIKGGNK